jgi:glycosyltransferase involved in cell wall biosynthesis
MTTSKPKVVFTAPTITQGFMVHDMALMQPYVDIIPLDLSECGGPMRYTYWTRLLRALLSDRAQVIFAYFVLAKYTPIVVTLAKVLRRKMIIVTGGIDATYVPDINWGDMGRPLYRRLFAYVMRLADSVLPFSNASLHDLRQYGHPRHARVAYLAVDTETFKSDPTVARQRRAVTASYVITPEGAIQKGVTPFVEAARYAPDVEFLVIGEMTPAAAEDLKRRATPNVRFTERRFNKFECAEAFRQARVYVQASAHEGFGVSLAEGMACECVPVVANRYAMPETVGGTGYLVPFNDPVALAQAIRDALAHPEKGVPARRRVVENFTEAQRQQLLREELEYVLKRSLES